MTGRPVVFDRSIYIPYPRSQAYVNPVEPQVVTRTALAPLLRFLDDRQVDIDVGGALPLSANRSLPKSRETLVVMSAREPTARSGTYEEENARAGESPNEHLAVTYGRTPLQISTTNSP